MAGGVGILALLLGCSCGAGGATREHHEPPTPGFQTVATSTAVRGTQAAGDRVIIRALSLAIAEDRDLNNRELSFVISNGDVSVTGFVNTEDERKKITTLAMNIDGVRSLANSLLVED